MTTTARERGEEEEERRGGRGGGEGGGMPRTAGAALGGVRPRPLSPPPLPASALDSRNFFILL